jgi:hypothetical protein
VKQSIVFLAFLFCYFHVSAQRELKYAFVYQDDYWYVIDTTGKILADSLCGAKDAYYVYNSYTSEGMFPYVRDGKLGYKNYRNELVIPCTYWSNSIVWEHNRWCENRNAKNGFINGQAIVTTPNKKCGVIDAKGRLVIDTVYDFISRPDSGNVYVVRKTDSIKLVGHDGKDVLPFYYQTDMKLYPNPEFNEGLLPVMKKRKEGDESGKPSILGSRDNLHSYKVGFVNSKGELVIDTIYNLSSNILGDRRRPSSGSWPKNVDPYYLQNDYYRFEGGRSLVNKDNTDVVISTAGDSVFAIRLDFRSIRNSSGFFIVDYSSITGGFEGFLGYGIIDRHGKMIVEPIYLRIFDLHDGFFRVSFTGLYGYDRFVDTNGKFHFKKYATADDFDNGFAQVSLGHTNKDPYGNINKKGHFLRGDRAWVMQAKNGIILAYQQKTSNSYTYYGYMNKKYKWIIQPSYTGLYMISEGLIAYQKFKNGKWGYMNMKENMIIEPSYDQALPFQTAKIQ